MALQADWQRGFPFVGLSPAQIAELIRPYSPRATVVSAAPLEGGLRNSNYLIRLSDSRQPVVLRVFSAEEPRATCIRESALVRLVEASVPVARLLHTEPEADPPWSILAFVDGVRFDEALCDSSRDQVDGLSRSAGRVLAAIHSYQFPSAGWLNGPELSIGPPPWPDISWFDMLSGWFESGAAGACLDPDLRGRLMRLIERNADRVATLTSAARLVHADYKGWNLLARGARVAAVLDWEFAYAGNPLVDVGIYMRASDSYPASYVTGFAAGYMEGGGDLSADWFELARLQDLTNLGYFLEFRPFDTALVRDVTRLISSTVTLLGA